jgi:type I restriction enzyme M protein
MDASHYKDYVLVLLFIKYVSDKYAGQPYAPITIPPGASFKDMVALKGRERHRRQINKKIIAPLSNANKRSDMPDFNDATKLGSGKEMVDRLTNLIAIFENKALDFSKNRADGDDILGDAYEYLMRHFATESGKSKRQFYTPRRSQPHHGADHWHPERKDQRGHNGLRPHLRLGLAASEGWRGGWHPKDLLKFYREP